MTQYLNKNMIIHTTAEEIFYCCSQPLNVTANGMLQIFSFLIEQNFMEIFKTVPTYVMAIYLFLELDI